MKIPSLCLFLPALGAFSSASAAINIETVFVGNAGNANDVSGFGGVAYDYHIGTHEVTNAQYAVFLNAVAGISDPFGLWDSSMGSQERGGITRTGSAGSFVYTTRENKADNPVNYVSFWDAARFTNWLTSGDTETGVYTLGGVTNPLNNSANYNNAVGALTDVGSYTIAGSYYGTFDQGGNVEEWNDQIFFSSFRGRRGGAINGNATTVSASFQNGGDPAGAASLLGFRVTSLAPIPEPSAYGAILGGLGLALALARRRGHRNLCGGFVA